VEIKKEFTLLNNFFPDSDLTEPNAVRSEGEIAGTML